MVEVQKNHGFLRFRKFPRDPLRGLAWSRCKNPWFFAISKVPARPSAGIGVVEVQKLEFFFAISAVLAQPSAAGVVSWFERLLPEPAGRGFDSSLVRGRASQDATCILKQLAQSNLRRASCTEQLAQTNLHRPVCAERLAYSNLRRATCAEQLTQSNLHRATCTEHLAWCCLALASRMLRVVRREKERILQRWADLACDVLLSGQPWSSLRWFSGLLARARVRPQPQHAVYGVLSRLCFRAGLRAVLFGFLVLGPLARPRERPHVNLLGWGPAGPRKLASPASSRVGVGNMHNLTSHVIAQDTFLIQNT